MNNILKYSISLLFFVMLFLSPVSVENTGFSTTNSSIQKIEIKLNKALASSDNTEDPVTDSTETNSNQEVNNASSEGVPSLENYLNCGRWEFGCKMLNAMATMTIQVGSFLVGLSAYFMDIFLAHSLQSSSYRDSGFIEQGWEILRNITNIVFIFALLMLAFQMVLDISKADVKKRFMKIIVIALSINFSLFMVYAIIDTSNIFANVFYNKIEQKPVTFQTIDGDDDKTRVEDISGTSASLAIAQKINPQQLLTNPSVRDGTNRAQKLIMVVLAGVINATLIYVFLSVTFLFLDRTIGLWITAIMAPLAMASLTIPGLENKPYIGFNTWFKSLIQTAFMAPVFIFFLYLAVKFMTIDIPFGTGGGDFITEILKIIIPMAVIVSLLLLAKKVAKSMAGEFGGMVSGIVGKVVGGAVAVGAIAATGGAALAGGALRGAGTLAAKSGNKNLASLGRGTRNLGRGLQSTNFNFGGSRAGKFISSKTGINMGAKMGNISYMNAENKAFLGAQKLKDGAKDTIKGRGSKELEAKYQADKSKLKGESGKWQDKIHEGQAEEILSNKERAGLKTSRDDLADAMKERTNAKNDATIVSPATSMNHKDETAQTELLKSILDETKKKTAEQVVAGTISTTAAKAQVTTAQSNHDTHFDQTFEGKVKKKEAEIQDKKNIIKNDVAKTYEASGKKSIAQKIIRGDIKAKNNKEDKDTKS